MESPKARPAWGLLIPVAGYFLLSGGFVLWMLSGLDDISLELTRELAEAAGLDGSTIDFETFDRLRSGVLIFGGLSLFLASGAVLFYRTLSRRRRDRFAAAFRKALEGEDGAEDPVVGEGGDLPFDFDGSIGSVRRAGRELRRQHHRATVSRSRLSRLTNFLDVGVLVFAADRRPELASVSAMRLLGEEGGLPSREIVERIFGALSGSGEEPPHKARAELHLEAPLGLKRLRLQLFHLDETCDNGYLVLLRDQRVLEALDTDLRLAAHLRVLSRLNLGVAHDLKAPLNAIGLNLAVLRSSFQPGVELEPGRRRRCVEVVEEELARLQRGVEQLLAQTAPGRQDVGRYDLRGVLEEIRSLLVPQAKQHGTTIELTLPAAPVWIRGRQDLAKQAILNVAVNALEAANSGGKVGLRLKVDRGRAFVCISDDGPGIPEDHRDHVFEMHFTTKEQGTGIGLYISQSVLQAEGGTLVLKETSEAGTVLEATLPLEGEENRADRPDR